MTAALLDPYVTDWLDLLLRWLHVIAGIVWIGTSFYFVALDNHLTPPRDGREADERVGGETWEIHGGGFYRVHKFFVAPRALPEELHWFKWEAYTTWLSGFALFAVLYYFQPEVYLVDDVRPAVAIPASLVLLGAAWVVYDALCRLLRSDAVLGVVLLMLVAAAAYGSAELFSPRAAYLQVGAMLGTIMSANVFLNIIPAHRELIRAKEAGREPNPRPGAEAKRRSVHNNYLTLPVVVAMIGNHFPVAYAHERAWLVLLALMVLGAWVRHFFNLRHAGRNAWWIPASAGVAIVALALAIEPDDPRAARSSGPVEFDRVREVVAARCATCHSAEPSSDAFTSPPQGVMFDTPEQISAQAEAIEQQAVLSTAMPLGNVTGMTQEERDLLGAWIEQGAKTE